MQEGIKHGFRSDIWTYKQHLLNAYFAQSKEQNPVKESFTAHTVFNHTKQMKAKLSKVKVILLVCFSQNAHAIITQKLICNANVCYLWIKWSSEFLTHWHWTFLSITTTAKQKHLKKTKKNHKKTTTIKQKLPSTHRGNDQRQETNSTDPITRQSVTHSLNTPVNQRHRQTSL